MSSSDEGTPGPVAAFWTAQSTLDSQPHASFDAWRRGIARAVQAAVTEFVDRRRVGDLRGADVAGQVLLEFIKGGKCLRSTFMFLGWLCGANRGHGALRAAASLELLHAFALLQDDVMDGSPLRRGRPSAHVRFARWHREQGLSGSPDRFGESAAVLLGDLCLVWAEQMLRDSGVDPNALARAWPRYDAMRTELAVGQFADLGERCRRPAYAGSGAGGSATQVGQLHGAPAA